MIIPTMKLTGRCYNKRVKCDARTSRSSRVRFYEISEQGFEWENEVSLDDGNNWWRDSTISAKRRR